MMDIMPSRHLVIQEYKKHGACSGLDPRAVFRCRPGGLWQGPYPGAIPGSVEDAFPLRLKSSAALFLDANEQLSDDMIQVVCSRQAITGGARLLLQGPHASAMFAREHRPGVLRQLRHRHDASCSRRRRRASRRPDTRARPDTGARADTRTRPDVNDAPREVRCDCRATRSRSNTMAPPSRAGRSSRTAPSVRGRTRPGHREA